MQTPRLEQILILILILALSVSCTPRSSPSLTLPNEQSPTATLTLHTPKPESTRAPRATNTPANNQSSSATQNLTFDLPSHLIDVILGRPTGNSITVSILAYQDVEGYVEYGPAPDTYTSQTPPCAFSANQPVEVLLDMLQANTAYTYRVRYRADNAGDFAATNSGMFSTQRASGSTFTFTIQADSHLDSNSNPQVYEQTLTNQRADQPDFVIDLGDTFMTDKYKPYTDAQPQYLAQRYYLSLLGQTAPLFLTLGNHDGEGAPKGQVNDMSTWSAQLRTTLFPNPIPNGFYTGNNTPDPQVRALQDYYAWTWGDALFIVLDPYWFTPSLRNDSSLWTPTLGEAQYQWLKSTLGTSQAKWKFVFIHQLIGGYDKNGRGGVEVANLYEWGGQNLEGSYEFDAQRPGWGVPIHQLLVANHVTAVFHGHDHLFVKQELDGIIYQEIPQPSASRANGTNSAAEYGYLSGDIFGSSGHLRVTVRPEQVTVDYVRAVVGQGGQVVYSYLIK